MEDLEFGRDYSMSDAELSLFAGTLAGFVERDSAELSRFGVTAADLSELIARRTAFAKLPDDTDEQAQIYGAAQHKEQTRALLQTHINNAYAHALRHFGKNSLVVHRMDISGLGVMTEADFLAAAHRLYHATNDNHLALAERGLSAEHLAEFKQTLDDFDEAVAATDSALSHRVSATRTRIAMGNALYALCTFLCAAGKKAYINSDYAKYADYIIYKDTTPSTPPAIVQNLHYVNGNVQQLQWDETATATGYQVFMRMNIEAEFSQLYSGAESHCIFVLPEPPVAGVSAYIFKVRARNAAGVGEFSSELRIEAA